MLPGFQSWNTRNPSSVKFLNCFADSAWGISGWSTGGGQPGSWGDLTARCLVRGFGGCAGRRSGCRLRRGLWRGRCAQVFRPWREQGNPGPKYPGRNNQAQRIGKMPPRRQGIVLCGTGGISQMMIMTAEQERERRQCHDRQAKRQPYSHRARAARIRRPGARGPEQAGARRGRSRRRGGDHVGFAGRGGRVQQQRRDADQLRGHAQPVRVPGRDQHRSPRRDHPEVGPGPGLQRHGLVLQHRGQRGDRDRDRGGPQRPVHPPRAGHQRLRRDRQGRPGRRQRGFRHRP